MFENDTFEPKRAEPDAAEVVWGIEVVSECQYDVSPWIGNEVPGTWGIEVFPGAGAGGGAVPGMCWV